MVVVPLRRPRPSPARGRGCSCAGAPPRSSASPGRRRSPPAWESGSPRPCTPPPAWAPSAATPPASEAPCPDASRGTCQCDAASLRRAACRRPYARSPLSPRQLMTLQTQRTGATEPGSATKRPRSAINRLRRTKSPSRRGGTTAGGAKTGPEEDRGPALYGNRLREKSNRFFSERPQQWR